MSAGGLARVEIVLNGEDCSVLVDNRALYNFMAGRLAVALGLMVEPCQNQIKDMNFAAQGVLGLASEVAISIGPWRGMLPFMVVLLDNFDVILGVGFLMRAKATPMIYLGSVMFFNEL